jgi:hypothetical protein
MTLNDYINMMARSSLGIFDENYVDDTNDDSSDESCCSGDSDD